MSGLTTAHNGGPAHESPGPRAAFKWLGRIALFAGVAIAAVMLVPAVFGFQRYVITGDSMTGVYDRGSIVYSELVPKDELAVGDVITYDPPAGKAVPGLVTHRIIAIRQSPSGQPVLRTKGDANATVDPYRFRLEGSEQARAVAGIPYLGYAFAALGIREVRMAVIGVPALVIAFALLAGLWRDVGDEARAAATGAHATGPDAS